MQNKQFLSMISATDDTYETCRRTIGYLLKQTVIEQIELVIVCPSREKLKPDLAELTQFGSYQIVEIGVAQSTGQMLAEGVRAARAPLVMYLEEHNYPPPDTAKVAIEEMIENDRPALGFPMLPSNPGLVAWAHLYGQFGWAVAPIESGPVRRFGGHHAAYRRELLLEYDINLREVMDNEAVLHEDLWRRGIEMYITSKVAIPHAQVSDFATYVRHEYLAQRIYGSARAQVMNWSLGRRLLYVAGASMIPFVRLWGSIGNIRRTGRSRELLPQIIPVILIANASGAFGEAMGYLFGVATHNAGDRMEIELDRYAFVKKADQKKIPPAP